MHFLEQLLLIIGLSMDGFTASVCMGMAAGRQRRRRLALIVLIISGFHIGMLLAGYLLGASCPDSLDRLFPWVAAILLAAIGINMLREASRPDEVCGVSVGAMAGLALATSMDAMTVGVAFALLEVDPWQAAGLVALIMGSLAVTGVTLGSHVGSRYRRAARTAGGAILCLLGLKLLLNAVVRLLKPERPLRF